MLIKVHGLRAPRQTLAACLTDSALAKPLDICIVNALPLDCDRDSFLFHFAGDPNTLVGKAVMCSWKNRPSVLCLFAIIVEGLF